MFLRHFLVHFLHDSYSTCFPYTLGIWVFLIHMTTDRVWLRYVIMSALYHHSIKTQTGKSTYYMLTIGGSTLLNYLFSFPGLRPLWYGICYITIGSGKSLKDSNKYTITKKNGTKLRFSHFDSIQWKFQNKYDINILIKLINYVN